ncbi:MAG TPA: hypothetical protein VMR34_03875 [Candidatus Saccharimonadales bacterium]|nr:hypothetical protein [Candidatus Saccharimonadales bacterium]
MVTIEAGGVKLLDQELVNSEIAQRLGKSIVDTVTDLDVIYIHDLSWYDQNGNFVYDSELSGEARNWLDEILATDKALLEGSGQEFSRFYLSALHRGKLNWHLDTPGDFRFIHNIGYAPTQVDVGTRWDPNCYAPGSVVSQEPEVVKPLVVSVGGTYVNNNLVVNTDILPPHSTPNEPDRLTLRVSAYAADGWERGVTGDGIDLTIGQQIAAS